MNWRENKLVKYFIESKGELQRVTWLTRKETVSHTLMVIGVCLGVAIFLGAVDFGLSSAVEFLIKRQ